jgi:hypothetical protein
LCVSTWQGPVQELDTCPPVLPYRPASHRPVQAAVDSWDVLPKVPGGQLVHVAAAPTL